MFLWAPDVGRHPSRPFSLLYLALTFPGTSGLLDGLS